MADQNADYAVRTSKFAIDAIVLLVEQLAIRGEINGQTVLQLRGMANEIGNPFVPAEHHDWARHTIARLSAVQRSIDQTGD